MEKLSLKNSEKYYLIGNFFFNLGRTLPQAILTVILLNKGINLAQITVIQSMFMVASLLFEFPFGILSDWLSEKRMYQFSLILLILSYLTILLFNQFLLLCLAWFLYGLSMASMSGTLDSYFIKSYKSEKITIKPFMVRNNNSMFYSSLVGGFLGSLLFNYLKINLYIVSIVLFIVSFLFILFGVPRKKTVQAVKRESLFAFIIFSLKQIKGNKSLKILIVQMVLFQIIVQCFYQYWQICLLGKGFSSKYFGLIFVFIQLVAILSNRIFAKISHNLRKELLFLLSISVFFILFLFFNKLWAIIAFFIFQVPFNLYANQLNLEINHYSNAESLSSTVSLIGTLTTIFSAIILWVVAFGLRYFTIESLILGAILLFLIGSLWSIMKKKNIT